MVNQRRSLRLFRGAIPSFFFSFALVLLGAGAAFADSLWPYDPSQNYPYGAPNPAQTDPEARIFDPLIGTHQCTQKRTAYPGGEVTQSDARWTWYHDMNGFGVRDVFRYGKAAPASQRVYNAGTKQWHVWYFVGQKYFFSGEWIGGARGDRLVLENPGQKLGDKTILSRLEFYNISEERFEWHSLNIDPETGENLFTDWEISCRREG